MLIYTAKFTRKKAAAIVIIAGAALCGLLLLLGGSQPEESAEEICLTGNAQRVAYLESFGWTVEPEPLATLQFLLPEKLSGDYVAYNELQQSQGFDLNDCCGRQITRYTYTVTNYPGAQAPVQANLYVCEGRAAAGDILCPGENGFQTVLAFPEASENAQTAAAEAPEIEAQPQGDAEIM